MRMRERVCAALPYQCHHRVEGRGVEKVGVRYRVMGIGPPPLEEEEQQRVQVLLARLRVVN